MPFTPPVPPKTKLEFGAMSGRVEFVDQVPNELICSICHKPAEDPQQTRCTCSKLYCLKCIQTSGKCSTCKKNLEAFPDGLSARRLRSLRVKCRTMVQGACGLMNGQHSKITSRRAQRCKSTALTPRWGAHLSASGIVCLIMSRGPFRITWTKP